MRILVVEDDANARALMEAVLGGKEYTVESAMNGADALEKARTSPPDLIISDIMMPEMDGFLFCRRVKEDGRLRGIPVILYTWTSAEKDEELLAGRMGATRFIAKPAELSVILNAIREELEKRKKGAAASQAAPISLNNDAAEEYLRVLSRKLQIRERDLVEAREKLSGSEARYRNLFENMLEGIAYCRMVYDAQGRPSDWVYVDVNAAFERITGLKKVIGRPVSDVLPGLKASNPGLFETFGRVAAAGRPEEFEVFIRPLSAWLRISVFRPQKGHFVSVFEDLTARKRAEEALLKSEARQRRAQKLDSIGALSGGIAHDLNNLLGPVMGYADLLRKSLPSGDARQADLDEIIRAADRAAALVRQLLAFSRRQVLEPRVISLNESVEGIGAMLRRVIGERIRLELRLDAKLGPVKADPGQIEQVILNLVLNARDSMPQGGEIVITTSPAPGAAAGPSESGRIPAGRYAALSVRDSGHGMDEAVKAKLFEPFFTTKAPGKGTGLGLSTAYGIIKQSGGDVQVESAPGKGSVFTIYLPLATGAEAAVKNEPGPAAPIAPGVRRVLLVEDDETMRRVTRRILTSAGYTVVEAAEGGEALRLLSENREPVMFIITDMVMPGMDGVTLAAEIYSRYPDMKILCMSGYMNKDTEFKRVLASKAVYLPKPFSPDTLLKKIDELLKFR